MELRQSQTRIFIRSLHDVGRLSTKVGADAIYPEFAARADPSRPMFAIYTASPGERVENFTAKHQRPETRTGGRATKKMHYYVQQQADITVLMEAIINFVPTTISTMNHPI